MSSVLLGSQLWLAAACVLKESIAQCMKGAEISTVDLLF